MVFSDAPDDPLGKFETIFPSGKGFPGWGLRLRVIRALGRIGPPAREAMPLLLSECENRTNVLRFDAAVAAWRIDGQSPELTATFEQGLHAADPGLRQFAIARLAETGAELPQALALLIDGLRDPVVSIRVQVVDSLAALGTNALPALPALRVLTNDQTFLVRIVATQALQAVQSPTHSRRE